MKKLTLLALVVTLTACTANTTPPVPTVTPSQTPAMASDLPLATTTPGFVKRSYNPTDKLFDKQSYPSELLQQKDTELIAFKCSPSYYVKSDTGTPEYGYYDEASKSQKDLTDPKLTKLFDTVKKQKFDLPVVGFKVCDLDNGKQIVQYDLQNKGGGAGVDSVFSYASNNNPTFQLIARIKSDPMPYANCPKILQLSANTMYVECGGGDGPGAGTYIHKVDIKTQMEKTVLACEAMAQEEGKDSKVTCHE